MSLPDSPTVPSASVETTDFGADFGYIFRIDDAWQLVVNAGRGFRAPNVFDLGTLGERPGNRFNVPNPRLDTERVRQADAGLRYRSDRATFEVTAFALRYDDRITSVLTGLSLIRRLTLLKRLLLCLPFCLNLLLIGF